jgi:hypothetical protein
MQHNLVLPGSFAAVGVLLVTIFVVFRDVCLSSLVSRRIPVDYRSNTSSDFTFGFRMSGERGEGAVEWHPSGVKHFR